MKKIIFLFLILFMSIISVKADDSFYLGEKVPNMYVESIKGSDIHNGAPFLLHRSDGSIVYCINPFLMMSTNGIYKEYNNLLEVDLPEELTPPIILIWFISMMEWLISPKLSISRTILFNI